MILGIPYFYPQSLIQPFTPLLVIIHIARDKFKPSAMYTGLIAASLLNLLSSTIITSTTIIPNNMFSISTTVPATLIFVFHHRQSPGHYFIVSFSNETVTVGGQVTIYVIGENELFTAVIGRVVSMSVNAQVHRLYITKVEWPQFFISVSHVTRCVSGTDFILYRLPRGEIEQL
jgi:hypothetical protein